jgi:hypothetical protein
MHGIQGMKREGEEETEEEKEETGNSRDERR